MLHRFTSRRFGGNLCGVRSALARSLEPLAPGTAPGDNVAIRVGQGDNSIVKGCLDMGLSTRDGLTFTPPGLACLFLFVCCHKCDSSPALLLSYGFFLARHRPLGSTARAGIGAGALTTHREVTAMAHTAIAANFNEPLNVHIDLATQVTFDLIFTVDELAQAVDLFFGQVPHPGIRVNAGALQDFTARSEADPKNVRQRNLHAFVA